MSYELSAILSFSIAFAAIIGWIRFAKINPIYYPFIYCVSLALINEIVSYFITHAGHSNAVNNNIYILVESLLILWQFKNWASFRNRKYLFWSIALLFLGVWLTENFIIGNIIYIRSYFRITYSFVLVLLSINQVNELIVRERKNILINSIFLICIGIVFYYTYKVLLEVFWVYGLNNGTEFRLNVYNIHTWINLLSNLIYALAIIWMPRRQQFLLPS